MTPPNLDNWIAAEYRDAITVGRGSPRAHWEVSASEVFKLSGHEMDFLIYQIPMAGNYVVEFDVSAGSTSAVLAGIDVEFTQTRVKYGAFRSKTATVVEICLLYTSPSPRD